MKLISIRIENFRAYKEPVTVEIGDFTAFVGKNDIGKSMILEALDIFFNEGKGITKLDKSDISIQSDSNEICITACFSELPDEIILDATNSTTLTTEYLTNADGYLEIVKKYPNAGNAKAFIRANHPTNPACKELLLKTNSELKAILERYGIACEDRTKNATMRKCIWHHFESDLQFDTIDIDITKGDAKPIWSKIGKYLPVYSLFQSDRKNSDSDTEVQDPLKEAVKQILSEDRIQEKLLEIQHEVETKLKDVADRTLQKLMEINSEIAAQLNPVIPPSVKWADVFKGVSIAGDGEIPINKRGSGIRRQILISFFRAEAERKLQESTHQSIIYAVEEPETSQHSDAQTILIRALVELSHNVNTQLVITTHSPNILKELGLDSIRIISEDLGNRRIMLPAPNCFRYVSYNEINYIAFGDATEEYHNELYGYIDEHHQLAQYECGQATRPYIQVLPKTGELRNETRTLTHYIRDMIHHPENTNNTRFTDIELKQSIEQMRSFIIGNQNLFVE